MKDKRNCSFCGSDLSYQPAKKDVVLVAQALVDNCMILDQEDDTPYGWTCDHCMGMPTNEIGNFKHDLDCEVLVAKDLLAGVK